MINIHKVTQLPRAFLNSRIAGIKYFLVNLGVFK